MIYKKQRKGSQNTGLEELYEIFNAADIGWKKKPKYNPKKAPILVQKKTKLLSVTTITY